MSAASVSDSSAPTVGHGPTSDHRGVGTYFLGRYRVVDEIGIGGMASVHLGRMDGPGGFQKWVAIKRIHAHLIEDESFIQMFLDEARVAARISHPNVATVFELGKHEDTYWIAMEYLHGEPLREVMRRTEETGQPMPPEIACKVIADAAEGLHAAHELLGKNGEKLGLVHRDVTPHNLFVTYDGSTKVVDFGIAKFASRMSNTRAGTLKGKLAYMSPEQVHGEGIDRRTDIFALGVVLWELTTGQRLFRMESDLDTLAKVQECNVARPSTIVRGYPIDLEKIVMKALAKNRGERFRTAREFSRALQSLLMRRGLFIAADEVSGYMQAIFQDRIQKREAHLRWAADVTQTINVDGILEKPELPGEGSLVTFNSEVQAAPAASRNQHAPRPAAGVPPPPPPAPGQRMQRALPTAQESASSQATNPRPSSPAVVFAPPPHPAFTPATGTPSFATNEIDDGPTIQAPPYMNPAAEAGRHALVEDQATLHAAPSARAAMIAAMVAEEASATATRPTPRGDEEDSLDDDQDDTIVQTTRVEPSQNRAAPPPAAGRPAPPPPAAGRPAQAHPMQGPVAPETANFRPRTQPPRMSSPHAPIGHHGPPPPMVHRPNLLSHTMPQMQQDPRMVSPPHSHPYPRGSNTDGTGMAPLPRFLGSSDNPTITAPGYRRRPPAWIVALGSAAAVLLIAAIVIGVMTTRRTAPNPDLTAAPLSTSTPTVAPPASTVAPPGGMGPFTTARAAFAAAITPSPAGQAPVPAQAAPMPTAASDTATPTPTPAPTPTPIPIATATATAMPTAVTALPPAVRPTPVAPPTSPTPRSQTGTGVLTVVCWPACDHVFDNGRDLGASPIWQKQVPAGEHRLKLTTSNPPATKILSVIVAADELKTIKQPMTP